MIKTETEYRNTKKRIEEGKAAAIKQREELMAQGLTAEQIEHAMEPVLTFQMQFADEVMQYERIKAGDLSPIHNLNQIGIMLIALRISRGMTQKELATRLKVSESVISRDEGNDYHGISVERAQRILDALEGQAILIINTPIKAGSERELALI